MSTRISRRRILPHHIRFTDQQRQLSRTESQERTNPNMPRRVRTESGYAPGSPQHSAGRDLSTNYGPGPGRNAQAGSNAGFAADGDGAHNSWWDSTGRSQDASHGTQVRGNIFNIPATDILTCLRRFVRIFILSHVCLFCIYRARALYTAQRRVTSKPSRIGSIGNRGRTKANRRSIATTDTM